MFKGKHGLTSGVFQIVFVINKDSTKLRSKSDFSVPKFITEYLEKNLIKYLGSAIWNLFPWTINVVKYSDFILL